jgi:parvulin-like peptidyl-prolyl isomerase
MKFMDRIRANAKIILWIIVGAFIGGVFLWNITGPVTDAIAKVNGIKIPIRWYEQNLYLRLRQARDNDEETPTGPELKRIKQQVVQQLIQDELLYQKAKKLGIQVTDEEVANTIRSLPQFQRDGTFYKQLYVQALNYYYHSTPKDFEETIRRMLAAQRVRNLILSITTVTDEEMKMQYAARHDGETKGLKDEEESKNFRLQLLQEKRITMFNRWVEVAFQDSRVEGYLDRLERQGG